LDLVLAPVLALSNWPQLDQLPLGGLATSLALLLALLVVGLRLAQLTNTRIMARIRVAGKHVSPIGSQICTRLIDRQVAAPLLATLLLLTLFRHLQLHHQLLSRTALRTALCRLMLLLLLPVRVSSLPLAATNRLLIIITVAQIGLLPAGTSSSGFTSCRPPARALLSVLQT